MLKGNFPFYVLNIAMDTSDVDVNVHPNKLAVHFRDENEITYVVLNAVIEALAQNKFSPVLAVGDTLSKKSDLSREKEESSVGKTALSSASQTEEEIKKAVDEVLQLASMPHPKVLFAREPTSFEIIEDKTQKEEISRKMSFSLPDNPVKTEVQQPKIFSDILEFRTIGVAFSSYIMVESGDAIYIVDQHAAHERKIYDRLMKSTVQNHVSQRLLAPIRVPISPGEKFLLSENMDIIESVGFEISALEDIYCDIFAIPQILGEVDVRKTLEDIVASLEAGEDSPELRKDRIAKGACKRAVKAGNKMSDADIRELIETIITSGSIPNCPHGRPIAISVTKEQLEIGFKRRV